MQIIEGTIREMKEVACNHLINFRFIWVENIILISIFIVREKCLVMFCTN